MKHISGHAGNYSAAETLRVFPADSPLACERGDPRKPGKPQKTGTIAGLRAASGETPQGTIYTIDGDALWAFDVKSEKAEALGGTVVATKNYITSLDADPTGHYLYYIPGAHGGAESDGSTLFVTWNGAHSIPDKTKKAPFQSVAMTAIRIPGSERRTHD